MWPRGFSNIWTWLRNSFWINNHQRDAWHPWWLPYITRMTSNEPVHYPYVNPFASWYLWQPEVRLWYPLWFISWSLYRYPRSGFILFTHFHIPVSIWSHHISVYADDKWHRNIEWAQIVSLHRQEEQDPILELFKSPYTLYNIPENHLDDHPIKDDFGWQSKHTSNMWVLNILMV